MTNWGVRLLDTILREGRLNAVQQRGVVPDMLAGPARTALEFIYAYADQPATLGMVPPRELVQHHVPLLEWPMMGVDAPPALEVACDMVVSDFQRRRVYEMCNEALERCAVNPADAIQYLEDQTILTRNTVAEEGVRAVNITEMMFGVVSEHHAKLLQGDGLIGLPYPWESLSRATLGMRPGELIFLYGIPKSMKTWVALATLANIYTNTQSKAMIYMPEMHVDEITLRMASLLTRFDHERVMHGWGAYPTPDQLQEQIHFYQMLHHMQATARNPSRKQPLTLLYGPVNLKAKDPLGFLERYVDLYGPQVLFVDSAYLLGEDPDHRYVRRLAASAKRLGDKKGITMILVSQENQIRAAGAAMSNRDAGASTVSFGQGLVEDSDLVINVVKRMLPSGGVRLALRIVAARHTKFQGLVINGNPGHDMGETDIKLFSYADVLQDQKKNSESERKEAPPGPSPVAPRPTAFSQHALAVARGEWAQDGGPESREV